MKNDDSQQCATSYSTGGGGFHYETQAVAYYLAALLSEVCVPRHGNLSIVQVGSQRASSGVELDDLTLLASHDKKRIRIDIQIKTKLSLSIFYKDFIEKAWATYSKNMIIYADESRPPAAFDSICLGVGCKFVPQKIHENFLKLKGMAETASDYDELVHRVKFNSNEQLRALFHRINEIVCGGSTVETCCSNIIKFLKCLHIWVLDFDSGDAYDKSHALQWLKRFELDEHHLWTSLNYIAPRIMEYAGLVTRDVLLEQLNKEGLDCTIFSGSRQSLIYTINRVNKEQMQQKFLDNVEKQALIGDPTLILPIVDCFIEDNKRSSNIVMGKLRQFSVRLMVMSSIHNNGIDKDSCVVDRACQLTEEANKLTKGSPELSLENLWQNSLLLREMDKYDEFHKQLQAIFENSSSKHKLFAARESARVEFELNKSNTSTLKYLDAIFVNLKMFDVNSRIFSFNNYSHTEQLITLWKLFDLHIKLKNKNKAKEMHDFMAKSLGLYEMLPRMHVIMQSDYYRSLYGYFLLLNDEVMAKQKFQEHKTFCEYFGLTNSPVWINEISKIFGFSPL